MSDDGMQNGLRERVNRNSKEIDRLWEKTASKESVDNLRQEIRDLRTDTKGEVGGLRKTLIGVSAAWLFGTFMFLIAALEFVK
jgi:hypothetical protein